MTVEERAQKAMEIHDRGNNCCQSVAAACSDLVNMSEEDLLMIGGGFGGGMGCMEATCGALVGAVMIAGLLKEGKKAVPVARQIYNTFEQKCGATLCKDLKGRDTKKVLCPCDECVRNGVRSLVETAEALHLISKR